jgi:lysozyme
MEKRNLKPAIDMIKSFEGLRLQAYEDPGPKKIPTIGYGTIRYPDGRKVRLGEKITKEQAIEYLAFEVGKFVSAVERLVKVPITNNQFCALVSFAYNLGAGLLGKSDLLKFVNAGKPQLAAEEFLRYVHASGKVLPGLVRRRKAERELFLS